MCLRVLAIFEEAGLPAHPVPLTDEPDGGEAFEKVLKAQYGVDFEPPIVFLQGKCVGRNAAGQSPHDFLQNAIRFDGDQEIDFDSSRGITGSPELDALIRATFVDPARR
jgi:hypothetical protein